MELLPSRRLKRVHERLLLSRTFAFALGWLFSVALPTLIYWEPTALIRPTVGQKTALVVTTVAFGIMHAAVNQLIARFPGGRSFSLVVTKAFTIYALVFLVTLLLRIEVSRVLLVTSGVLALIWFHIDYLLTQSYLRPKLAVIPGGLADEVLMLASVDARPLTNLDLGLIRYDGVVADFERVCPKVKRFLTQCALNGIPVYNANVAYEALTGRVKINKMSENNMGSFILSPAYELTKRLFDLIIVVVTIPITLFICGLAAIFIRLESPGSVIYTQTRIGKGNKPFVIYKLRSMRQITGDQVQRFAGVNDQRITRTGKIIRKLRIDELPQLLNVLKGDMSIIGPRPEQGSFVEVFETEIPFYSYRHMVKPGITGWAQVKQGYADSASATQEKVEYDFYYIKHCSFALDLFIVFLTIRTLLTGYGAR